MLLRKERSYAEVYNDLDRDVVTLFRVLRDPVLAERLVSLLRLTPFARDEFNGSYQQSDDPVEVARRLLIRSFMGFGSDGVNSEWRTGFRANSNRSGTIPAHDWANYPDVLVTIIDRLAGVVIENRHAAAVMSAHDGPDTLHYVDPPYVHATRSRKSRRRGEGGVAAYRHELTDDDHVALLDVLKGLEGMVVLSGYEHPLYDDTLPDWDRVTCLARADGARERKEVLWINPLCARRLRDKGPLFEVVA